MKKNKLWLAIGSVLILTLVITIFSSSNSPTGIASYGSSVVVPTVTEAAKETPVSDDKVAETDEIEAVNKSNNEQSGEVGSAVPPEASSLQASVVAEVSSATMDTINLAVGFDVIETSPGITSGTITLTENNGLNQMLDALPFVSPINQTCVLDQYGINEMYQGVTSCTFENLESDTTYDISYSFLGSEEVVVMNDPIGHVTTLPPIPMIYLVGAQQGGVGGSGATNVVNLSWEVDMKSENNEATSFRVYRNGVELTPPPAAGATSYTDSTAPLGRAVYYVEMVYTHGTQAGEVIKSNEISINVVDGTTLATIALTAVQRVVDGDTTLSADLNWSVTPATDVKRFDIYMDSAMIARVHGDVFHHLVSNLKEDTSYTFQVIAETEAGAMISSNVVTLNTTDLATNIFIDVETSNITASSVDTAYKGSGSDLATLTGLKVEISEKAPIVPFNIIGDPIDGDTLSYDLTSYVAAIIANPDQFIAPVTLVGLEPNTAYDGVIYYQSSVSAVPTDWIAINTFEFKTIGSELNIPTIDSFIASQNAGSTDVTVSWVVNAGDFFVNNIKISDITTPGSPVVIYNENNDGSNDVLTGSAIDANHLVNDVVTYQIDVSYGYSGQVPITTTTTITIVDPATLPTIAVSSVVQDTWNNTAMTGDATVTYAVDLKTATGVGIDVMLDGLVYSSGNVIGTTYQLTDLVAGSHTVQLNLNYTLNGASGVVQSLPFGFTITNLNEVSILGFTASQVIPAIGAAEEVAFTWNINIPTTTPATTLTSVTVQEGGSVVATGDLLGGYGTETISGVTVGVHTYTLVVDYMSSDGTSKTITQVVEINVVNSTDGIIEPTITGDGAQVSNTYDARLWWSTTQGDVGNQLIGFNIYRDGEKLNTDNLTVESRTYLDPGRPIGLYTYTIELEYLTPLSGGVVSRVSSVVPVEIIDLALLTQIVLQGTMTGSRADLVWDVTNEPPATTYEVYDNFELVRSIPANGSGTYSASITDLTEGQHTFFIVGRNSTGESYVVSNIWSGVAVPSEFNYTITVDNTIDGTLLDSPHTAKFTVTPDEAYPTVTGARLTVEKISTNRISSGPGVESIQITAEDLVVLNGGGAINVEAFGLDPGTSYEATFSVTTGAIDGSEVYEDVAYSSEFRTPSDVDGENDVPQILLFNAYQIPTTLDVQIDWSVSSNDYYVTTIELIETVNGGTPVVLDTYTNDGETGTITGTLTDAGNLAGEVHDYQLVVTYGFDDSIVEKTETITISPIEDHIAINACEDLETIEAAPDETYYLTQDLDCAIVMDPIEGFGGTLTSEPTVGAPFTISGISVVPTGAHEAIGIFGSTLGATIANINFDNVSVLQPGVDQVGSLIGYAKETTVSQVMLTNVQVSGSEDVGGAIGLSHSSEMWNVGVSGNVSGVSDVGGAVGTAYYGASILSSFANTVVTVNGDSQNTQYFGGMVGTLLGSTIQSSYANSQIEVSGLSQHKASAGGVVGKMNNDGTNSASIKDTWASGSIVSTDGGEMGGIASEMGYRTDITNCVAINSISSGGGWVDPIVQSGGTDSDSGVVINTKPYEGQVIDGVAVGNPAPGESFTRAELTTPAFYTTPDDYATSASEGLGWDAATWDTTAVATGVMPQLRILTTGLAWGGQPVITIPPASPVYDFVLEEVKNLDIKSNLITISSVSLDKTEYSPRDIAEMTITFNNPNDYEIKGIKVNGEIIEVANVESINGLSTVVIPLAVDQVPSLMEMDKTFRIEGIQYVKNDEVINQSLYKMVYYTVEQPLPSFFGNLAY